MQPVVVLGQAAITDFAVAEDLLDIPERMPDLCTNTGFDLLSFQFVGIQHLPGARPFSNQPRDAFAVLTLIPLLNTNVAGITKDSLFFTVNGHLICPTFDPPMVPLVTNPCSVTRLIHRPGTDH